MTAAISAGSVRDGAGGSSAWRCKRRTLAAGQDTSCVMGFMGLMGQASGTEESGEHSSHDLRIDNMSLSRDDLALSMRKARCDRVRCVLEVVVAATGGHQSGLRDRRQAGGRWRAVEGCV